jgi:hypothetical protein
MELTTQVARVGRLARIGAVEPPAARRRRERAERRTLALGLLALGTTGAVGAMEVGRVWRRGSAPLPVDTHDVLHAAEEATRQAFEVAVSGYKSGSRRENALLALMGSFTVAFGIVRASTHTIRRRGTFGPFRDIRVGDRHIHHFVPGIALAFVAGAVGIISRDERLDPWLAIPFGTGVALTLDESALLLKLDDVYWTEEGIVSVQITLAALAMLSAVALALRVLRRGEQEVLDGPTATPRSPQPLGARVPTASR